MDQLSFPPKHVLWFGGSEVRKWLLICPLGTKGKAPKRSKPPNQDTRNKAPQIGSTTKPLTECVDPLGLARRLEVPKSWSASVKPFWQSGFHILGCISVKLQGS